MIPTPFGDEILAVHLRVCHRADRSKDQAAVLELAGDPRWGYYAALREIIALRLVLKQITGSAATLPQARRLAELGLGRGES